MPNSGKLATLHSLAERFGAALVADFQQFYGLRFTHILVEWHPAEVMALVTELPQSSRFHARMQGEAVGSGFSQVDWLLLDMRNAVESLRVMTALRGQKNPSKDKAKKEFREWSHFPGAKAQKRRRSQAAVESLKRFVSRNAAAVGEDQ